MSETCENACPALTRLEQQVDVIRQQNGDDHKEFRQQIHKIERDEARQEAKLDNITSALSDLKGDNKEIISKLTPLSAKVEALDKLDSDVDELKSKPGKKWEKLSLEIIGAAALAIVAFLLGRLGL